MNHENTQKQKFLIRKRLVCKKRSILGKKPELLLTKELNLITNVILSSLVKLQGSLKCISSEFKSKCQLSL